MGNLDNDPLEKLHVKYLSSSACGSVQEDFLRFYYIFLCKTADPWGGVNFDTRDIIWAILVEVHYTVLQTKYLSSSTCGLVQEDF